MPGPSVNVYAVVLLAAICLCRFQVWSYSLQESTGKTVVIAGATGYIGKSVVRESVRRGFKTIALVRDRKKIESPEGQASCGQFFEGAEVVECDVKNSRELFEVGGVFVHTVWHSSERLLPPFAQSDNLKFMDFFLPPNRH
jgi:NADPH-dependent curcumin reductase CurA